MGFDWENLHGDYLGSILDRLGSRESDVLNFSVVCKAWYYVAEEKLQTFQHLPPPMLLIPIGQNGIWKLYNVMDDKLIDLQLDLSKKRFCGSSKGWLIAINEDFEVQLINPLFRLKGKRKKENSIITLPPLLDKDSHWFWVSRCNYKVLKATLSAHPVSDPNNCIVLVVYEELCQVAFFRLNKDKKWTYLDDYDKWNFIHEVVVTQDKFYAIGYWSMLLSFDITANSSSDVKVLTCAKKIKVNKKSYLVSLNEKELLMIRRHIHHDEERQERKTYKFKVSELDWETCTWIEKDNLGDIALFLGDNSSIAVSASKFPGCQSNCIYFNHDHEETVHTTFRDHQHHDFGVYDLKTRRINSEPYGKFAITLMKNSIRPPIWFRPNLYFTL